MISVFVREKVMGYGIRYPWMVDLRAIVNLILRSCDRCQYY
jgi:hypothetical protein